MSGEILELARNAVQEAGITDLGEAAVAGMTSGGAFGAILGYLMGAISIIIIVATIIAILKIIAYWRIFKKAGEKGWKAIIPILNSYTETKVAGTRNFPRLVISYIAICVGYFMLSSAGNETATTVASIGAIVTIVAIIWYVIERIIRFNGLAKNFGKGTGYVVLWIFFPTICELVLGLGGSQYNKIN